MIQNNYTLGCVFGLWSWVMNFLMLPAWKLPSRNLSMSTKSTSSLEVADPVVSYLYHTNRFSRP
jgi:hypothetical protein